MKCSKRRTAGLLLAVATLAACGGGSGGAAEGPEEAAGEPVSGGQMTVGVEADWVPLDPARMGALADRTVATAVYDTLVGVDEKGEFVPRLALSWDSPDAKTYTVELRPDVVFHDGTPLDAAAVVAHFERLRDPATACRCAADVGIIESVQASDADTVVMTLKQASAAFPAVLADVPGMIASPAAVQASGDTFGLEPVGAGPFKLEEYVPGDHVTFSRFEEYWDEGKPYLDGITYRALPDNQSRFAALQAGDVDLITVPDTRAVETAETSEGLSVIELPALGSRFVMYQNSRPPFDDVKARLAVTYASDMHAINESIFGGRVEHVQAPFAEGYLEQEHAVESYPEHDLEKAKQLVEELGGLSFTLNYTNTPAEQEQAQALQAQWAEAGIQANLVGVEQVKLIQDAIDHNFEATLFRWPGRYDPDLNSYQFFHSSSNRNYTQVKDAELDELLERGRSAVEPEERKKIYADVAERLGQVMPYNFIYGTRGNFLATSSVQGVPRTGDWVMQPAGVWMTQD